jgi:hypothetical protein
MVDIMLKADQVRSAPAEVRSWLKDMLRLEQEAEAPPPHGLAECTTEEAALVLTEIQSDYLACQVFFELGRQNPAENARAVVLHKTSLEDIMHHVRLANVQHLAACLDKIGAAFLSVRGDPEARLFVFDDRGGCYVHQTTRQSVRSLWETLVIARMGGATEQLRNRTSMPVGPTMPIRPDPAVERTAST